MPFWFSALILHGFFIRFRIPAYKLLPQGFKPSFQRNSGTGPKNLPGFFETTEASKFSLAKFSKIFGLCDSRSISVLPKTKQGHLPAFLLSFATTKLGFPLSTYNIQACPDSTEQVLHRTSGCFSFLVSSKTCRERTAATASTMIYLLSPLPTAAKWRIHDSRPASCRFHSLPCLGGYKPLFQSSALTTS